MPVIRQNNQIRPVAITYNSFGYATSSVLFEMGNTKVLCSISLQNQVPSFLRGQKKGWLTAEYAMLPCATQVRTQREGLTNKRSGRIVEISRLIGRVLRSVVNLDAIGERTIHIDCDVLQADGGTRTASITGSWLALRAAVNQWLLQGLIKQDIIIEEVAALSVGIIGDSVVVDLDYHQDSNAVADFNFVVTKSGKMLEVQGTAEKYPVSWEQFDIARAYALDGFGQLFAACSQPENIRTQSQMSVPNTGTTRDAKSAGLFSLASRQGSEKFGSTVGGIKSSQKIENIENL